MNKQSNLFSGVKNLSRSNSKAGAKTREIKQLVGELRPEDGIDPRYAAKRRRHERKPDSPGHAHGEHKQEQLFSQIQLALDSALQCAAAPALNELTVHEVIKQGGSLVVVVGARNPAEPLDVMGATQALKKALPMLSREVACAITRKEAPKLTFVVLPTGAQRIDP